MSEPSKKQLELEQSIFSISAYNKISKQNKLIEKGLESETYYARNMIEAGLDKLTEELGKYIYESMNGKVGVKALAAILLDQFPDLDVVSFIAFKVIIDSTSLNKTTTSIALKIGQMLEDELRFTVFEDKDPKHFKAIKDHTKDTRHEGYRRKLMIYHMNNKGHEYESWSKENKLRVGLKLIDLIITKVGMVKLTSKKSGKATTSYVVFTDIAMKWIRKQRTNRIAAYPLFLPCYDKPRPWVSITEGGYYTERLKTRAIKTANQSYLDKLQEEDLTRCLKALTLASQTAWTVDKFVLETLVYCWEERIEVGSLIDRELADLPTKPVDMNDKEALKQWRHLASLIHDMNAQNKCKRFQILSMIDTAKKYLGEKFHHVYQFDFCGRMYPLTAHFHPQGNDMARGLHIFHKGGEIKTKKDADWLAIAGANYWGLNKEPYENRLEWAYIEGTDTAEMVYLDPKATVEIWGEAADPFQFLSWCKEWAEFNRIGYGYVSRHCCSLDGTNNGYQHIAGLISNQALANKVNLQNVNQPQDLYKQILDILLQLLKSEHSMEAKEWYAIKDKLTRKFIKQPVLMVPYNSTTFGIANYIEKYFVNENISMAKNFKNNFYLATMIQDAVKYVTPESYEVLKYLAATARCFNQENKPISWRTPSGFFVQQNYYVNNTKRIKTKLSHSSIRLHLNEPDVTKVDKRKQHLGFPSNYIHSLDAAHCHLSLIAANEKGLNQFCVIHDCYGSPASDLETFIQSVKQSFFKIYSNNNLNKLHDQAVQQLSDSKKLPTALNMGDFNISDVLTAPYIFT